MKLPISFLLLFISFNVFSQFVYEPSERFPFGQPNPSAPEKLSDYAPLIGICDCKSISRKQDQSWADTVNMTWTFQYIMNGMAIQDETLKEDGTYSGSIRQYIADSASGYRNCTHLDCFPVVFCPMNRPNSCVPTVGTGQILSTLPHLLPRKCRSI